MSSEPRAVFAELWAKRPPSIIKPGLSRIEAALKELSAERLTHTPTVIVGGTNGKGTTSSFLWRLLCLAGEHAGLYTSPHLIHFSERITLPHNPVNDDDIERELVQLRRDLSSACWDAMSFFEVTTVLALRLFKRRNTTINVLEVGLGGRLDATNVCRPLCSVIVSIGLDHCELLGNTPAAIAREKAGIMRPGVPVFWGGRVGSAPEADRVIREEAARLGAPLFEEGRSYGCDDDSLFIDGSFDAVFPDDLRVAPHWMKRNFALAWGVARHLGIPASVLQGWSDHSRVPRPPSLQGRFDWREVAQQKLLIDVCHNPHGAEAFVSGLPKNSRWPALVSILRDKDIEGILKILRPAVGPLILFSVPGERALRREDLSSVRSDLLEGVDWCPSWQEAWDRARAKWSRSGEPWIICGSVHAVGDVLAWIEDVSARESSKPSN
jgi:dihydrofolate synthase/folylpolyglutamate synthase